MQRPVFIYGCLAAAVLAAGCDSATAPSPLATSYALARIGALHLPIPVGPADGAPFLIADTLELGADRPREETAKLLRRIQVLRDDQGHVDRSETQHLFSFEGSILTYDTCPFGALCLAMDLVYAPRIFQLVGDSLFQVMPTGAVVPQAVYGRVHSR